MKNILKNYIFMYISIFLPKLLSFLVLTPFLSNTLGVGGTGITSYTHNIINYAVLFATFGISVYGNKKIAESKNNVEEFKKNFSTIFFLQFIFHIITFILFLILINFVNIKYKTILLIFSFFLILNSIDLNWFFAGNEDFKNLSISNIINYLTMFIILILFIKNENDTLIYAIAVCSGRLLSCLYSVIIFIKKYKIKNFEITNIKYHLKNTFIFFIPELLLSMYTVFDQILLGYLSNTDNVALYNRAISYIKLGVYMITILCTLFFPKFSNLHKTNKNKAKEYFNKIFDFLLMISIPFSLGFIATSRSFISWYLPYEFSEVSNLIIFLAPSTIFMIIGNICGTYLMSTNNIKKYAKAIFIGAFTNIIINLSLIKLIGPYSLVVATLLSECCVCLTLIYFIKQKNILYIRKHNIIKYILNSIIMFVVVSIFSFIFKDTPIYTILEILIGVFIYFILIFIQKKSLVKH